MVEAAKLFESAMEWLQKNYRNYRFFTERDIVWTLQTHIMKLIGRQRLDYQVFNNYSLSSNKSNKHSRVSTDLAIISPNGVEVAAEFKYEPSHDRKDKDIKRGKFPVVSWDDPNWSVVKDVKRIREYTEKGWVRIAYSIFIDEGSYFSKKKKPPHGSEWRDWGSGVGQSPITVLWSKEKAKL